MMTQPLKISYCTTCKGRLHHLKQTLPANLAAEKDNPNVEFVVLDYDSPDGLGEWIKENFQAEIASGRLRYARLDNEPHFKMAHAKNMAHRLATGDVLCSVDADNFIVPNFSRWLSDLFAKNSNSIVGCGVITMTDDLCHKAKRLCGAKPKQLEGMGGRIAISRDAFERLHGYDEHYSAWGGDDLDFMTRAIKAGFERVNLEDPYMGSVIHHDNSRRVEHLSEDDRSLSLKRLSRGRLANSLTHYQRILSPVSVIANPNGHVGNGTVHVNFSAEPTLIPSLAPAKLQSQATEVSRKTDWAAGLSAGGRQLRGERKL